LAVLRPREGAKIFGSALLQPARSVCVASERFFIIIILIPVVCLSSGAAVMHNLAPVLDTGCQGCVVEARSVKVDLSGTASLLGYDVFL